MTVAAFVLTNVRMFAGGADLTSRSNKVEITGSVEDKETTNYASAGWKERIGGLGDSALSAAGMWEAGDLTKVDDQAWNAMGTVAGYTIGNNSSATAAMAAGDLAYLVKAMQAKYTLGGQVGDVAPWNTEASGSWPVARGLILNPPGTARTATGNGTATQGVAVAAGQFLYATLHVISVTDGTLTVKVQSSVDNTFGSPTDQLTFSSATSVGGQMLRIAGPITDTWWRATWTISGGSTHSFLFVVAAGVK